MKLNVRHVLIALVALIVGSIPAIALAQTSFPPSTSAAGSQYGGSTTGTTTTGTTTTITSTNPQTTTVVSGTTTVVTNPPTVTGAGTTSTTPGGGGGGGGGGTGGGGGGTGGGGGGTGGGGGGGGGNNGQGNGGDNGGNAPGGGSGRAAGGAGAGASGVDARLTAPYITITLSPVNFDLLNLVHLVTGITAYDASVTEPVDVAVIKSLTAGTKWAGAESDNKKLASFARALGKSIVDGGVLAKAALPKLATGVDAKYIHPVSGVVLIHTLQPLTGAADKRRDAFITNLVKGIKKAQVPTVAGGKIAVPVVGVETSKQKTTVPFFKALGVSTVDDLDKAAGRTSLSRVLNGATGNFGIKKGATSGKVAKRPTGATPLLYRPSAAYTPGELLRDGGGSAPTGILLLVSLLSVVALLAVVERRTRARRRSASA